MMPEENPRPEFSSPCSGMSKGIRFALDLWNLPWLRSNRLFPTLHGAEATWIHLGIASGHLVAGGGPWASGKAAGQAGNLKQPGGARLLDEISTPRADQTKQGVLVESRRGAVTLVAGGDWLGFRRAASVRFDMVLFPLPAHRTGRAGFPHPALGESSRFRPRKASSPFGKTDQAKHLVEGRCRETFLPRPPHFVLDA